MTSVDNILGLVSHLHSMESSFSAILIEAAMKLASLTDANLFILVETKDGELFCTVILFTLSTTTGMNSRFTFFIQADDLLANGIFAIW